MRSFLSCLLIACALFVTACTPISTPSAQLTPIRIGWQTTWATQGQIAQTLAHTNVLQNNRLEGTLFGATYGAPLNEAALAGEVDVIFTADQPAATLLARSENWVIIGRLMFNRVALYVPPNSPVQTVADLKGKRIAMPFGAAAQRVALKALIDAGLDPATDIEAVNLDITEQAGVIQRGTAESWGDVDAMAGFDPTLALFESNGSAQVLHLGVVTSVIVMSKEYITNYPDAPTQFLKAFREAVFYYAQHQEQANNWFLEASQLALDPAVLTLSASVEPNLQAKSIDEVTITLSPDVISKMQEAADFIFENGMVQQQVTITDHIDQSYAEKATTELSSADYNPTSVQVTAGN